MEDLRKGGDLKKEGDKKVPKMSPDKIPDIPDEIPGDFETEEQPVLPDELTVPDEPETVTKDDNPEIKQPGDDKKKSPAKHGKIS